MVKHSRAIGPEIMRQYANPSGQIHVSRETRSIVTGLKLQLAVVKGFELRPMADANDGRVGEPFVNQLHQLFLTSWIKCRGRFIHNDYFWMGDEHASESEPLLLPPG